MTITDFIQIWANIDNTDSNIIWKIVRENKWDITSVQTIDSHNCG